MAAVQFGILLNGGNLGTLLAELLQKNFANGGVGHFAAAETDRRFHLVAGSEELKKIKATKTTAKSSQKYLIVYPFTNYGLSIP